MEDDNSVRHGRHCVFQTHVHLVFAVKYRPEVFTKEILVDLRSIFAGVWNDFEAKLVEFDGEDDHVHLLLNYHPKVAVSHLVNSLKGVSSRMIRQKKYPSIPKKLWGGALWSPSYFAGSCGGAPFPSIVSTSSSNRRRVKASFARRALHPRPEGRSFPRNKDKFRPVS